MDLVAQQKDEGSSLFPNIEVHTGLSSCFNPQSQSSYYSESGFLKKKKNQGVVFFFLLALL